MEIYLPLVLSMLHIHVSAVGVAANVAHAEQISSRDPALGRIPPLHDHLLIFCVDCAVQTTNRFPPAISVSHPSHVTV